MTDGWGPNDPVRHPHDQGRSWCMGLAHELRLCTLQPTLARISDIRALLAQRPDVKLPAEWERVVEEARAWLTAAEARLPVFAKPQVLDVAAPALPSAPPAWVERYPA